MRLATAAFALMVVASSCASGDGRREVLVFAASSLTDVLATVEADLEAADPDLDVRIVVGGSSSLREQILDGAPADLFVSADPTHADAIAESGRADGDAATVARAPLRLVVPAGNPGAVADVADLADPDLVIGLCAVGVPCGDRAREMLDTLGVEAAVDTEEPNVRALLTKVVLAELDAAIVYAPDVLAAGDEVEGLDLPAEAAGIGAVYTLLAIEGVSEAAGPVREHLVGPAGRATFAAAGFEAP